MPALGRESVLLILPIACLALMADAEDSHEIEPSVEAIECKITARAPGDDKLAPESVYPTSDEGVGAQNHHRSLYMGKGSSRGFRRSLQQEFNDPLKLGQPLARIDYHRHL